MTTTHALCLHCGALVHLQDDRLAGHQVLLTATQPPPTPGGQRRRSPRPRCPASGQPPRQAEGGQ